MKAEVVMHWHVAVRITGPSVLAVQLTMDDLDIDGIGPALNPAPHVELRLRDGVAVEVVDESIERSDWLRVGEEDGDDGPE